MTTIQPTPQATPDLRILSMKEVCVLTGFSRTHIYRLEAAGRFPRRRKLGISKIGFINLEVREWIENLEQPELRQPFNQ